jgi:hypothetical protein
LTICAQTILESRLKSKFYGPKDEPELTDLLPKSKGKDEEKALEMATYSSLIYASRNKLIHEFSSHGIGPDLTDRAESYQMATFNCETQQHDWELAIGVKVFSVLAHDCLRGAIRLLRETDRNPFVEIQGGQAWS